jgi:predicted phage terminase large subunit-like protein
MWALDDCWRFATVDLAASTRTAADYTVIAAWARTPAGDLVLLDRVRAKVGEEEHFGSARPLVERWRLDTMFVEASQHGTTLVREASTAGIPITPLYAEQDKFTRALPASAWCSSGRVWLPSGAWWVQEWVDEAAAFPNATHDDQIDVLAWAVRVAATKWAPLEKPPPTAPTAAADPAVDDGGLDLATVQF